MTLIAALSSQTLARNRFEVLIGDDGSTDGLADGLREDGWLRLSSGPSRNSYAARNRAASLARARILAFCDADCVPEAGWLEAGLMALGDADVAGGLIQPLVPERPTAWTLLDLDLHVDQERAVRSGRALGGNLFVTREAFLRVGGFDESLPNGGDYDFVARSVLEGARLTLAADSVVWHPTHDGARELLGKVWRIQRANGVRNSERPRFLSAAAVPVVSMVRSRKRAGRPLGLDRRRLGSAGERAGIRAQVTALAALYLLLPALAWIARFAGWRTAERERRAPREPAGV